MTARLAAEFAAAARDVPSPAASDVAVGLFLDFLEGKVDFQCTPWGIASYTVFGWQRPSYLMSDGYTEMRRELVDTTDWDRYGRGKDPRCAKLHGALRVRTVRSAGHHGVRAPVDTRRALAVAQRHLSYLAMNT